MNVKVKKMMEIEEEIALPVAYKLICSHGNPSKKYSDDYTAFSIQKGRLTQISITEYADGDVIISHDENDVEIDEYDLENIKDNEIPWSEFRKEYMRILTKLMLIKE